MELNFNGVDLLSKPSAEVSSLGYAQVPLTFNPDEAISELNASGLFKTDSGKVFKEDAMRSFLEIPTKLCCILYLADELCMFDNVPESITRFFDLRSSSFATRHSPNKFGFALAAPSGDFKAFARELFMSDYDMGDGGHVFRTC